MLLRVSIYMAINMRGVDHEINSKFCKNNHMARGRGATLLESHLWRIAGMSIIYEPKTKEAVGGNTDAS